MKNLFRLSSAILAVTAACFFSASCSDDNSNDDIYISEIYSKDEMWLCRPGIENDHCAGAALDATLLLPDGTRADEPFAPADDNAIDCFYIYPTVDISTTAGIHDDFSDISDMLVPLESQASRFASLCDVYAPLYRQATIGSYLTNKMPVDNPDGTIYEGSNGEFFETAYQDVLDAFSHYMAQYNNQRPLVIMGHSQGAMHLTRLLQEKYDDSAKMRRGFVAALLIGGSVEVPSGETSGKTFKNIPLCTSIDETGCVIAYRSYLESMPPAKSSNGAATPGTDAACTNPAALSGGRAVLKKAYFPLLSGGAFNIEADYPVPELTTPFSAYPEFYEAECIQDANGRSFLAVNPAPSGSDTRSDPIIYSGLLLDPSFLGTHILDYNYALGDLLFVTEKKAEKFMK